MAQKDYGSNVLCKNGAVVLKTSCDRCTLSKVKCSGGHGGEDACERCASKGFKCVYSPKKRRGPSKKRSKHGSTPLKGNDRKRRVSLLSESTMHRQASILSTVSEPNYARNDNRSSILSTCSAPGGIGRGNLRRYNSMNSSSTVSVGPTNPASKSWTLFFYLWKRNSSSVCKFWFDQRLCKMYDFYRINNSEIFEQFNRWVDMLGINLFHVNKAVKNTLTNIRNSPSDKLLPNHNFTNSIESFYTAQKLNTELGFLTLSFELEDYGNHAVTIDSNASFDKFFPVNLHSLKSALNTNGAGLLPWGGDLLMELLELDEETGNRQQIVDFFTKLCHLFNNTTLAHNILDPSTLKREVDCEHRFFVRNSRKQIEELNIKFAHREVIHMDSNSSIMEIAILVEPICASQWQKNMMIADELYKIAPCLEDEMVHSTSSIGDDSFEIPLTTGRGGFLPHNETAWMSYESSSSSSLDSAPSSTCTTPASDAGSFHRLHSTTTSPLMITPQNDNNSDSSFNRQIQNTIDFDPVGESDELLYETFDELLAF